ncbi:hypothetical protein [[Scytonema hofmanni] UTEX B 1581]|nr:hypothetical protein [[Scytonema hofmanni] UTEX B 1581]
MQFLVHLSGLKLLARNFSSGRDDGQCDTLTVTKMWVKDVAVLRLYKGFG